MLTRLALRDFAIAAAIELEFGPGLTVVSGETGDGDAGLDDLRRAILKLPDEYREPLVMQVLGGLTTTEIAQQLGLTQPAVLTRLFRARNRLREIYGLAAIRLEPDRATLAPSEAARLRAQVFTEGAGFWLDGAVTDSLGRVLRRFVR